MLWQSLVTLKLIQGGIMEISDDKKLEYIHHVLSELMEGSIEVAGVEGGTILVEVAVTFLEELFIWLSGKITPTRFWFTALIR